MNQLLNININDQDTSTLYNKVSNKEKLKLKKGQLVSYTLNDIPYTVEILGCASKATGLYKTFLMQNTNKLIKKKIKMDMLILIRLII